MVGGWPAVWIYNMGAVMTALRPTELEIRTACNLTQHQMAIKLAIGLRTYERYEAEGAPERVLRHMELVREGMGK